MVAWKPDPEFWSATRAERAFVEGYELVAFDIPPVAGGPQRVIGWEVWSPKLPGLGTAAFATRREAFAGRRHADPRDLRGAGLAGCTLDQHGLG